MTKGEKHPRGSESEGNDGPPPPKKAKKSMPPSRAARKTAPNLSRTRWTSEEIEDGIERGWFDREEAERLPRYRDSEDKSEDDDEYEEQSVAKRYLARKSVPETPAHPNFAEPASPTPTELWPAATRLPSFGVALAAHPDAMAIDIHEHEAKLLENNNPLSSSVRLRVLEETVAESAPIDITLKSAIDVPQIYADQGSPYTMTYWRYANLIVPGETWVRVPDDELPAGAPQIWRASWRTVHEFVNTFWQDKTHPARLDTFIRAPRGGIPGCRQHITWEVLLINPSPTQQEAEEKDFPIPTYTNIFKLLHLWAIMECNKLGNQDRIRITYLFKDGLGDSLVKKDPKLIAQGDDANDYFNKSVNTKSEINPHHGTRKIYEIAIKRALHCWTRYLNRIANTHMDGETLMKWITKRVLSSLSGKNRTDRQCGYTNYVMLRQLDKKPETVTQDGRVQLRDKSLQRYVESIGSLKDYLELDPVEFEINKYAVQPEVDMFETLPDDDWDELLKQQQ